MSDPSTTETHTAAPLHAPEGATQPEFEPVDRSTDGAAGETEPQVAPVSSHPDSLDGNDGGSAPEFEPSGSAPEADAHPDTVTATEEADFLGEEPSLNGHSTEPDDAAIGTEPEAVAAHESAAEEIPVAVEWSEEVPVSVATAEPPGEEQGSIAAPEASSDETAPEQAATEERLPEGSEAAEEDAGSGTPQGGGPTAEDECGYDNKYGNVRQRASAQFAERIIGRIRGGDANASLAFYRQRFAQLERRFEELRTEVEATEERGRLLGRLRHLVEYVPRADAVGDFDTLMERLRTLEREVVQHVDELHGDRRQRKEELCVRAESLADSTDWKPTSDKLRGLQEEWKGIGYSGREQDEVLWQRFRSAQDKFFQRRQEHWDEARTRKSELCERAEALTDSSEWKKTGDQLKALQEEWKQVGSAGREQDDLLWKRFRGAQDQFFNRRSEALDTRNREEAENLKKKELLCVQIEALVGYPDPFVATNQAKELQAQWKQVGPAPRDQMDAIWKRFRKSCDQIFERAAEERDRRKNEKDRRQDEWRTRMAETLERKVEQADRLRESLQHDQANIARWEETLQGLRTGGRAEEIRYSLETKITDVQSRMQAKQDRLNELDSSIRDIQARLKHR